MRDSRFEYEDLQFIKSIFERTTEDYIFIYDLKQDHYMISERASQYFQLSECEFFQASDRLQEVIHPDDYGMVSEDLKALMDQRKTTHALEYRWKTRSGKYVWISCRGEALAGYEGKYMVGTITEIGKHNRFDNVTGLYCESVMENEYKLKEHKMGDTGCMLLIGIDNFKEINEKHGSELGNKVLENVASMILRRMGDIKQVYRMRGDEFAIVVPGIIGNEEAYAKALYKSIRHNIDRYIASNGYELFFTISAGGIIFNARTEKYEDVIQNLRFALHSAKIDGKNRFCMFTKEKYQQYVRKIDIQENLRVSIDNDFQGFQLFYQPIYGTKEETILGAEALLRWKSEKYGIMSPVEFIPLLEESALIIPLGRWIIETAAAQCERWCVRIPDFIMHINLSFVQIIKSNIMFDILDAIRSCKLDHSHFVFEVTESGEMDSSRVVHNVLKEIHDHHFELAVDDFGTGYSNMCYIKDLMFGIIKIDRSFIADINKKKKNYMMVKSIIEMFHGLNLSVCVEGVETKEELEAVRGLNPDTIQGFYYGRPVPCEEFEILHLMNS